MHRPKDFPGTDPLTNGQLVNDITADERAIIAAIRALRERDAVSLEEIGFVLGVAPGQISRYLTGAAPTTLKNYLRIIRALGYRCRMVFEKLDESRSNARPTSEQRLSPRRVLHLQGTGRSRRP